ncbi:uncharacterized protein PFL1_05781 [Pseudozyma flocculosa PF-1]|uniref:Uncharacterized protein n=1 Tax=Pseudozyma flocculosa PF-1 TaxID=1277687 RepID=A0A061H2U9_9BASI|nr:uncharacterized protein PFL1_05781 [Pseudozyma flocculosa PF-1]EPQ26803.1 hypothetical protein PFL1_05781 [Pseudozyma flocculosa PF-1]
MKLSTRSALLLMVLLVAQYAAAANPCADAYTPGVKWKTYVAGKLGWFNVAILKDHYQYQFASATDGANAGSWTLEQKLGPNNMETIVPLTSAYSCFNVDPTSSGDAVNAINAFVLGATDRLQDYYINYKGALGQLSA